MCLAAACSSCPGQSQCAPRCVDWRGNGCFAGMHRSCRFQAVTNPRAGVSTSYSRTGGRAFVGGVKSASRSQKRGIANRLCNADLHCQADARRIPHRKRLDGAASTSVAHAIWVANGRFRWVPRGCRAWIRPRSAPQRSANGQRRTASKDYSLLTVPCSCTSFHPESVLRKTSVCRPLTTTSLPSLTKLTSG